MYGAALVGAVIPPWALENTETLPFERVGPRLVFVPVPEPKRGKNRLDIDLAPLVSDDRDGELPLDLHVMQGRGAGCHRPSLRGRHTSAPLRDGSPRCGTLPP